MSIYRTNNPTEFDQVDGIIIDETSPAGQVRGVGTGVALLVGQFQRGPATLEQPSDTEAFYAQYGKSSYLGNIQLLNKKFSALKIVRVIASDAAIATKTFSSAAPTATIKFDAKSKGVFGNSIQVTIEAGSVSGKKYTLKDLNANMSEYYPDETYDNVAIAGAAAAMAASKIATVTVLSTVGEPANAAASNLAGGTDGTIADTDYQTAIAKCEADGAGNFLFLDSYNQVRNSYLKVHVALTTDKMVICSEEENDTVSDNETDAALLRDSDGRIIYASNWLGTIVDGVTQFTCPAAWVASIMSQSAPNIDPAFSENTQFLAGVTAIKKQLSRNDYIRLNKAGVCSFEFDKDIGFKIKSGVVTQIANSSKVMIFRRRMADYLTDSIAKYLKIYQNGVNSLGKRQDAQAAITDYNRQIESDGLVPSDKEMDAGTKASLIDIKSKNTNQSIAAGKFYIIYKRRIYSSMRYIILQAEIGEGVVVTEQE